MLYVYITEKRDPFTCRHIKMKISVSLYISPNIEYATYSPVYLSSAQMQLRSQ